jgi:hypothetical protein
MSCLEVRDRLAEFALGVLPATQMRDVERHLEWCTGCRKEAGELQQGLDVMAGSVAQAEPPAALEERIVARMAVGREVPSRVRRRTRRAMMSLGAAALIAIFMAFGAIGWGVAERLRVQDLQLMTRQQASEIGKLRTLLETFPGRRSDAELRPVLAGDGSGVALISSNRNDEDWVLISVTLSPRSRGTYRVEVTNRNGRAISGGPLQLTSPGGYVFWEISGADLSKAAWVTVFDGKDQALLTGGVVASVVSP